MLMIAWLFIKSAFSKLMPFIVENWRVILICLICWYAYHEKTAHDRSVQELALFKQQIAQAVEKQNAENAQKVKSAKLLAEKSQKEHEAIVKSLGLDRNKLRKELENEQDNLTAMLNDAYRLRVQSSSSCTSGKVSIPTSASSESERNSDTIATLVKSCQLTTIDYNALRQSWDDNCKVYGCE